MIALAVAVAVFVASLYAGGPAALYTCPVWGTALVLTWAGTGGRKLVEWVPIGLHWVLRSFLGQTRYRRRIVKPRPAGTLAPPGDAAPLRQYEDPESGAVMVHDPHAQTLTALVEVTHPSFILLDPGEQERRVHAWGRVLSTACRSTRIARLQVLERTVPDSGQGLAQWWAEQGTDDDSWVARTYRELIDRAGPTGERHISTISLPLDMRAAVRPIRAAGGGLKGAAAVLRQEMDTLTAALRTADLKPSDWYTAGQLAIILRSAYDPAIAAALERAGDIGKDLAAAGPVAVEETVSDVHDGALWLTALLSTSCVVLLTVSITAIAGAIGVWRRSTIATIVSAIILIALLGNAVAISQRHPLARLARNRRQHRNRRRHARHPDTQNPRRRSPLSCWIHLSASVENDRGRAVTESETAFRDHRVDGADSRVRLHQVTSRVEHDCRRVRWAERSKRAAHRTRSPLISIPSE